MNIIKISSLAQTPEYKTRLAAGADLTSIENFTLAPMERKLIGTGIAIELPEGWEAQIRPRSGLAWKEGITVLNSPGTIDADYRGEIKVMLVNLSKHTFHAKVGDRIAQMVIAEHKQPAFDVADSISSTERGGGGFGSTGK